MDDLDDVFRETGGEEGGEVPLGWRGGLGRGFDDDRVAGEEGGEEGVDNGQVWEAKGS